MLKRLCIALLLLGAVGPAHAVAEQTGETTSAAQAYQVEIEGPIGPAVSAHVVKAVEKAATDGAPLLILRMDTPGGLDSAMRDIIKAILASTVPVVSYVGPPGARAASAGTYILYASHVAVMAPSTNLGAATPIPIGGPTPPTPPKPGGEPENEKPPQGPMGGNAAERKAVNDAVAYIRGLAESRGRNADWAEQAVRTGASLSAEQALKKNVIDLMAGDTRDLLRQIDGRQVDMPGERKITLASKNLSVQTIKPDWRTELLAIITNPTVAYILMMIGIYGLILEGYNPGAMVPGVVGAICLLLALFAFQVLPVNYAGLALIVLGLALMMAEAFVPSFGVLGLGGLAAFVFGSVILMDTDVPGYQVPVALIAATASAGALAIGTTVYLLMRSRKRAVVSGSEALLGHAAEVLDDFVVAESGFSGRVWLAGEAWHAVSQQPLHKGQTVTVVNREGLTVSVEPAGT